MREAARSKRPRSTKKPAFSTCRASTCSDSTTTATQANFEGNGAANEFLLYAPNTAVRLAGNGASYAGAFVGKTIEVAGNGYVYQPAGYAPPPFGGSTLYARQSYVECTGAIASPPNAGC